MLIADASRQRSGYGTRNPRAKRDKAYTLIKLTEIPVDDNGAGMHVE